MSRAPTLTFDQALSLANQQLSAGNAGAAEELCRRVLKADPNQAPALHLLGVIAAQTGDLATAVASVRRASEIDPSSALYFCNLCEISRQAGALDDAMAAGRRALDLAPDYPQALNNLAIVHFEQGEFDTSADLYRRAIALAPAYPEAHNNLGNALRAAEDYDAALAAYGRALALKPIYPDALNNLGTTLRDMGRTAEAEVAYRKAHALDPLSVSVLDNLALALKDLERLDEAATLFECVLKLDPANSEALTRLAHVRLDQERIDKADDACRQALALKPDDPAALNVLGLIAAERDEADAAEALFRRAIAGDPDLAEAYTNLGNLLKKRGLLSEAQAAHEQAVELDPRQAGFYVNLADGHKFTDADDPFLVQMRALERDIDRLSPTSAMHLRYALAKAHDDLGEPTVSFRHLAEGSRLKRAKISYDEANNLALFDRVRAAFDGGRMARLSGGDPSELPIFVLGMPRSGTTLVEQVIASHPLVHGAGELDDLAQIVGGLATGTGSPVIFPEGVAALNGADLGRFGARYVERLRRYSADATRITDKMPSNFFFVGLIALALPKARIVHVVRDPVDTCLSCFSKLFADEQNHTYDLAELGRYYRKYAELMAHWRAVLPAGRMLEVRYEDMVGDLEGQARRLIAHCGLEWDDRCLDFHQTRRAVRTASASQVRRPIYATSQGRWRPYAEHLGPLLAELGDLAPPL